MNPVDPDGESTPPSGFEPIPVPPEVVEESLRTLDWAAVEKEFLEVQTGRGLTFEQCMEAVDALVADLARKAAG